MKEMLLELVSVLLFTIQGLILSWYAGKFAASRFAKYRLGKYYIIPVYVVLHELLSLVFPAEPGLVWNVMGKQVLVLVLIYLCIWGSYETYFRMRIYISVTFMAVGEICFIFVLEIMQLSPFLFEQYIKQVETGKINTEKFQELVGNTAVIMQIFMMILYAAFLWGLIRLITKNFRFRTLKIGDEELLFLICPSLTGLALASIFRGTFYSIDGGVPSLIYDKYPFLYFMIPFTLGLILAEIILAILSYQKIAKKNEEAIGNTILKEQMEAMEEHFKEMERNQEDNRRLRHELKNIMTMALSQTGNANVNDEWKEFLSDVSARVSENSPEFLTGSSVIDSLITMKYHEALERIPEVEFRASSFFLPESLKIRVFDLSIIIGNALDNAIEACCKVNPEHIRFIEIASVKKRGMLLINIRNSFDGRIEDSPGEKFPKSTKSSPGEHGIGMENMERVVDRYYGGISFETEGGVFILHVMMQDREPLKER
ncbi:sensor histidine kinase [Butyrivibrio sp. INlla14]|uniref:sensor histidine kinase n=1 Tax=Butyrivibrio sp. INlla14 TaxID=1520808 RepID=UPI000876ED5F|nr:sensor histidine kinase [Butyrivibrio sp. INlla14]SCY11280.1 GHKL domain-containing protein [Butyrivibrio sp. INlla14]